MSLSWQSACQAYTKLGFKPNFKEPGHVERTCNPRLRGASRRIKFKVIFRYTVSPRPSQDTINRVLCIRKVLDLKNNTKEASAKITDNQMTSLSNNRAS